MKLSEIFNLSEEAGELSYFPEFEPILVQMEELEKRIEAFDIITVRLYLRAVNIYRAAKEYERTGNIDLYWVKFNDYVNTLREYYDTLTEEEKKAPLLANEILALSLKYVMYCSPADYIDEASEVLTEKIPEGSENFMYVKDSFYTKAKEEGIEEGKKEGIEKGVKKGKKLESLEVVIELLERKLKSSLSEELRTSLESATYSQLKLIRLSIFEVESEEDVFELLEK